MSSLYISMSALVLANMEALNAVESIGNIVRHRKAQVITVRGGSLKLETHPAVSGESLRHCYQEALARIASMTGLPLCPYCRIGEFVKRGVEEIVKRVEPNLHKKMKDKNESLAAKELEVIKTCVVEDVGGFLIPYAEPMPVKRTSAFQVGYMIPALYIAREESTPVSMVKAEQYVRHAPSAQRLLSQNAREQAQALYYVEVASALYTFSFVLDVSRIGRVSICDEGNPEECNRKYSINGEERAKRIRAAILAIHSLLAGECGAKRSSHMPYWTPLAVAAIVSKPIPLTTTPGLYNDFITRSLEQAEALKKLYENAGINIEYKLFYYVDVQAESLVKKPSGAAAQEVSTIEELVEKLIESVSEAHK